MTRMNWNRSFGKTRCNLGDVLGPLLVAGFAGEPVRFELSLSPRRRWITIGTIGQWQMLGTVDIWGAGFGGSDRSRFSVPSGYRPAPLTRFVPHAVRGPFTRAMLCRAGYSVPEIFGDPAMLLPRLWPAREVEKRWDLGVVLHVSEQRELFRRYHVPATLADSVVVLDTWVDRNTQAVRARLDDLLSCRRILSTGLHALILAEAYRIPCAAFDFHEGRSGRFQVDDNAVPIDHRVRDFYAGCGVDEIPVYRRERHLETDWDDAIAFIDREWSPLDFDARPLVEAVPRCVGDFSADPRVRESKALDALVAL